MCLHTDPRDELIYCSCHTAGCDRWQLYRFHSNRTITFELCIRICILHHFCAFVMNWWTDALQCNAVWLLCSSWPFLLCIICISIPVLLFLVAFAFLSVNVQTSMCSLVLKKCRLHGFQSLVLMNSFFLWLSDVIMLTIFFLSCCINQISVLYGRVVGLLLKFI